MLTRKLFLVSALSALAACVSAGVEIADQTYAPQRFSAEVTGRGPDVILIPGLASSRDVWDTTVTQLSRTHRVHALQLAGFAGEPLGAAAEGAFVRPFVDDLARYIATNNIQRPAIIGHSLGGVSALILAKEHPESVGRVMVVDALPFFSLLISPTATAESIAPQAAAARDQMLALTSEQFAAGQRATIVRLVRTEGLRETVAGWSIASDRSAMARGMYDVMTTDLRGDLTAIQTPVTIVYANDPAIAPEAAITGLYSSLYAPLPNHRLVQIDRSYHFVPLDNPAAFAAAVTEFLR